MQLIINGQPTEITEQDYKEIVSLIMFKKRLKESVDKQQSLCYTKGTKKER